MACESARRPCASLRASACVIHCDVLSSHATRPSKLVAIFKTTYGLHRSQVKQNGRKFQVKASAPASPPMMQVTPEGVAHFLLETPQLGPKTRSQNAATASAIPTSTWHPKVMQIHTNPYIQSSHPIHRNLKRHSFLIIFLLCSMVDCHRMSWFCLSRQAHLISTLLKLFHHISSTLDGLKCRTPGRTNEYCNQHSDYTMI